MLPRVVGLDRPFLRRTAPVGFPELRKLDANDAEDALDDLGPGIVGNREMHLAAEQAADAADPALIVVVETGGVIFPIVDIEVHGRPVAVLDHRLFQRPLDRVAIGRKCADMHAVERQAAPIHPGRQPRPHRHPLALFRVPHLDHCIENMVIAEPALIDPRRLAQDVAGDVVVEPLDPMTGDQHGFPVRVVRVVVVHLGVGRRG